LVAVKKAGVVGEEALEMVDDAAVANLNIDQSEASIKRNNTVLTNKKPASSSLDQSEAQSGLQRNE